MSGEINKLENHKSPLFSILVVTYNAESYIDNTLQSIKSQTLEDYEIIIKDGCSSDNTVFFAKKYSDVIIISEPDNGIYDAMNQALIYAKGEFIIFINAGDQLFNKQTLLDLEKVARAHTNSNTIIYGDIVRKGQIERMPSKYNEFMSFRKTICHQSIIYNRKVFELIGFYDTNYKISSDYEHLLRCRNKGTNFVYIRQVISSYLGDGFSEKKENYFLTIKENKIIRNKYFSKKKNILWSNLFMMIGLVLQMIPRKLKDKMKKLIL